MTTSPHVVDASYPSDGGRGTGAQGGEFVKQDNQQQQKAAPAAPAKKPAPASKPAPAPAQKPAPKPAPKAATPAGHPPGPPKSGRLNLKRGGQNNAGEVRNLQALLADLKVAGVAVDGQYGPATEAAVKAAQAKLGMKPTGRASSALIRRMADAHALSPCIGKVSASVADEDDEPDAERVVTASAGGLGLTLWSDETIWVSDPDGEMVELDREDASRIVAGLRVLSAAQPGSYEVSDWLTLQVDDDGSTSLIAGEDDDDDAVALALTDLNEFADQLAAMFEQAPVTAAAGADTTPGHDNLHHYWVAGPGLARWADSPTPWTALLAGLVEEVKDKPLDVLKRWASAWFIEVKGYAAGSDKNRVAHGHPPRGNNVGPG